MQVVKRYPHGTFSWVDLTTTDQDRARTFYKELFDWESNEVPMGEGQTYTMFHIEGHDVAALSQMEEEQAQQGMLTTWNSYVSVDDVDAATEKAQALGGALLAGPFDVFDAGRMSILQDPTGAIFSLWQAGNHIGSNLVNMPRAYSWAELATGDAEKAKEYYTALFDDWAVDQDETGYYLFHVDGRSRAGMMQMTEEWGDIPPHWLVYFGIDDIDRAAERVEELGGTVVNGPFDAGDVGRIAIVKDPTGGTFALYEGTNYDPPPDA